MFAMMKNCLKMFFLTMVFAGTVNAQTPDELQERLNQGFNSLSALRQFCGTMETLVQVKGQTITIVKSSSNFEFDNDVVTKVRWALDDDFNYWVEFPVAVKLRACPDELILVSPLNKEDL